MKKIQVIYWSQTGNTKAMAEAVGEGIVRAGAEAEVMEVSEASVEAIREASAFALGCPAMGAEELEESEMEPFVAEIENEVNGKQIALFGSYGWGDGAWMADWEERMKRAGASLAGDKGVICADAPEEDTLEACRRMGELLVSGK